MHYDEFLRQVHHRARLTSRKEAEQVVAATMRTLGERLPSHLADQLAQQLPLGLAIHLQHAKAGRRFSLDGFYQRVASRESKGLPEAIHHTRVVMALLNQLAPAQMAQVEAKLPIEFAPLFASGGQRQLSWPS